MRKDYIHLRFPGEGALTGGRLVSNHPQGVQVTGVRGFLAASLLGGQILRRAHHHASVRKSVLIRGGGNPEIGELHNAIIGEQNIGRLNIAVHHPVGVHRLQCVSDLQQNRQQLLRLQAPAVGQILVKGAPVNQFHHDPAHAVSFPMVEDGRQVRVRDLHSVACFHPQTLQEGGLTGEFGAQYFDGDFPMRDTVAGRPHFTHRAHGDLAGESVAVGEYSPGVVLHYFAPASNMACATGPASEAPPA